MDTSKNKIEIPITVKKYEGYTVKYRTRLADKITFPFSDSDGSRLVRIGSLEIYDYDHSARFIKEGQRIKIEAPFCFNAQLDNTEIELNSESFNALEDSPKTSNAKRILVYLCVDSIDELKGQQNLEDEYKFTFKWEENSTSPNSNEQQEAKVQTIKPYIARAIPEISFLPLENCLEIDGTNSYNVIYSPEDTDGYRFCLGNIVVRNLQKIPYKDKNGNPEQVSLPNLQAYLTLKTEKNGEFPTNVGYIKSDDSFVNTANVNILNGQDDVTLGVFVDWKLWKNANSPISLFLRVFTENWKEPLFRCKFKMSPQYYDDVYSLDLGTSGIVVAMQVDDEIKLLELKDQDVANQRIEKHNTILSSVSILKEDSGSDSVYSELAPRKSDTYEESTHILVPTKFIVGQSRIPFINYNSETLKLETVYAFGSENPLDMRLTNNVKENEAIIKTFISHLYSDVFSRFDKNAEEIKKIIVTYPNTYTSETLEEVKCILKDNLGLKLPGQISFVPESDAVAAFYFNQRIFNGGFPLEKERVIIYDMGAGTLDLSLVEFCRGNNNHHTARILNKIGIPIAGNYLDYIIYNGLEKYITDKGKSYKGQLYLKEAVADFKRYIPVIINNDTLIGELQGELAELDEDYLSNQSKLEIQKTKYCELLGEAFNDYIDVCSSTAIDTLLDGYKDIMPNTIVFSGRASQLLPLKKSVNEYIHKLNPQIKEDVIMGRTSDKGLKVCVAEGALRYMDLFDENSPHKIENKNQYANVAVVYWGESKPGVFDVQVRYLLKPNDEDWNDAEIVNGTFCKDFHRNATLDNIVSGTRVYYVQTFLGESELKKLFKTKYTKDGVSEDVNLLKWGFVNILFDSVIRTRNQVIDVELEITKDNVITKRRVGVNELKDAKILENVENNILYRHSMWPNVK